MRGPVAAVDMETDQGAEHAGKYRNQRCDDQHAVKTMAQYKNYGTKNYGTI